MKPLAFLLVLVAVGCGSSEPAADASAPVTPAASATAPVNAPAAGGAMSPAPDANQSAGGDVIKPNEVGPQ